ncbi:hypothetical protein B0H63DRAFT_53539 [Podospora didyma]|uniref:RED-like N-terminal domain-containing protein n=1 Tax=Podospora didyma TaxID=330526 RepID=A0AAE0U888_9PEZI|nr:hypothetical protein B0H63DRAFT_53539 [Podospora didyma]
MNNDQFRKLVLANAAKPSAEKKNGASSSPGAPPTPSTLGSRLKSSIPMTPRSVITGASRVDFLRQLSEKNNQTFDKAQKKQRTSMPKGSKFAAGYVDRAKTRQEQEEEDDRAARLKALEESFRKEEIDQATYDRLRSEIAGGDLSSTHLVKGLDFKLLERIRNGDDVWKEGEGEEESYHNSGEAEEQQKEAEPEEDPDDILEQLESAEVKSITREKTEKKGQYATTTLNPGQKRSRNQILAEMKAAREAAAKAKAESSLGSRFKKIGEKKTPGTRIERDDKGREVMIIVDEDGHERRKVRKVEPRSREEEEKEKVAFASGSVLGMEVPEFYKKQLAEQAQKEAEEARKEVKIFDDEDSDYDPLAGLEDDSDDDSSAEEGEAKDDNVKDSKPELPSGTDTKASPNDMPPPPKPGASGGVRNYFKDSKTALTSAESYKAPSLNDASFLAALAKAKAISAAEKSEEEQKAAEREERLKKKLQESNRDDDDLDLGFGSNRVEDEADGEDDAKVKLSTWSGRNHGNDDDDEDGGGGHGDKSKRKRGPKKRKGDKNSFEDVMRVMNRNKKGS